MGDDGDLKGVYGEGVMTLDGDVSSVNVTAVETEPMGGEQG